MVFVSPFFLFSTLLGEIFTLMLTNLSQVGWNHQLVIYNDLYIYVNTNIYVYIITILLKWKQWRTTDFRGLNRGAICDTNYIYGRNQHGFTCLIGIGTPKKHAWIEPMLHTQVIYWKHVGSIFFTLIFFLKFDPWPCCCESCPRCW